MTICHSDPTLSSKQDPKRDHVAICQQLVGYEFPWEISRALELALLRTFCNPRIAHLLNRTGEFVHRPQKRYDDTGLLMGHIMKWGYDSPQGEAAIAQMNRIHRRYRICNEDFLYVLSVLIYEPVRWNARYGWRAFTDTEKQALFYFWRAVGDRMQIQAIPETYAAFQQFNQAYEAAHFRYSEDNAAIGRALIALIRSWLPTALRPLVPPLVSTLVDDRIRQSLGWAAPHPLLESAVQGGFRLRRWLLKRLPRSQRAQFFVDAPNRSYPHHHSIQQLGPDTAAPSSATSRCPFLRMRQWLNV